MRHDQMYIFQVVEEGVSISVSLRDRWHFWEVVSWNVPLDRDRMLATAMHHNNRSASCMCVSMCVHASWHTVKTNSVNT